MGSSRTKALLTALFGVRHDAAVVTRAEIGWSLFAVGRFPLHGRGRLAVGAVGV
jgi:hypothetical protein